MAKVRIYQYRGCPNIAGRREWFVTRGEHVCGIYASWNAALAFVLTGIPFNG